MHRGLEGLTGLQADKEMLDFQTVGGGITLQEEGLRLVCLHTVGVPLHDFGRRVVTALQQSQRTQHFKALVVAVGGAARGVDLAQAALDGLDGHCGAVKVAGLADGGVGQAGAGGAEPGGLVAIAAQNPAEHVKVVDQHVAEDAAGLLDVFHGWRAGVAAGDDQHFGVADIATVQADLGFVKRRVKAALETDHASHACRRHGLGHGFCAGHGQVHRLFAEDVFASGLWIALPMIGVLMFTNFALGIISRIAPQMNIFAIGFPITLAVGLIGIDGGNFWSIQQNGVDVWRDVGNGIVKSFAFGVICTAVALYQGYETEATPEGVAHATTRTVVVASLTVLGLDFILTAMMFSI